MYNYIFGRAGEGAVSDRFKNHRFKDLCTIPPPDQRPLFWEHKDIQAKDSTE